MSGVDLFLIIAATFAFATAVWATVEWIQYWRIKKNRRQAK